MTDLSKLDWSKCPELPTFENQQVNPYECSGVVTPSMWEAELNRIREEAERKGWIVPEPKVWMENGVMHHEIPQPRYRTEFRTITTVTIKESDEVKL